MGQLYECCKPGCKNAAGYTFKNRPYCSFCFGRIPDREFDAWLKARERGAEASPPEDDGDDELRVYDPSAPEPEDEPLSEETSAMISARLDAYRKSRLERR